MEFRTERTPVYHLENIPHCACGRHRIITEGKVGGERDLLRPGKGRMGGRAAREHPVGREPTVRFCEVFNKPHTQERVDLSALCEVCEVCEVLDKKIN